MLTTVLKKVILFFLLTQFCLHSGSGQNPLFADGTPGKKATIKYLLERIQSMQNIQLSYNENALGNLNREIELPEGSLTLEQVLEVIAKQGNMQVKKVGKNLVLKPAKLQSSTISGYVTDGATGESLIGTTIRIKGTSTGSLTNVYGFYSLTLPAGPTTLVYTSVGYETVEKNLIVSESLTLNVKMSPSTELLEEVVVSATAEDENVSANRMGHATLSAKTIQTMPALLGEADVMRALKLLPGVAMTSETSSGFSVRGGGFDQNLILLDEAVVTILLTCLASFLLSIMTLSKM